MEITFKSAHTIESDHGSLEALQDLAEKKLTPLSKYLGKYDDDTKVYVELGKVSAAHQNGPIWQTQINLDCDGKRFHAQAIEQTIEVSLDKAVRELESELRKAKERNKSMQKKGGNAVKEIVREVE